MAKGSDNPFPSVLVVEGTAPASPPAGDQRLFIDSADHKLKRVNSSGTVTTVEGVSSAVIPTSSKKVAAGATNFTLGTTWAAPATDGSLDVTVAAKTGDHLLVCVAGTWGNEATWGRLDAATMVSSAPVSYVSSGSGTQGTNGVGPWTGVPSAYSMFGVPVPYTVLSGDLASGNVTLRVYAKCDSGSKTLNAGTGAPLYIWVVNLSS